mgnify:CR=1 FL=1
MATLKAIRRRVSSVRNIQQITKAMKMVSAARLRRAQEAAIAARPYAEKLEAVLQNLATQGQSLSHPLLTAREEQNIDLLLVTSDRGLCGGFNSNLVRAAEAFIRTHPTQKVTVTIVGRRGYDYFRRRPVQLGDHHINLFGRLTPALANQIGTRLSQWRNRWRVCLIRTFPFGVSPNPHAESHAAHYPKRTDRRRTVA